jgi:hypothetical protein
MEIIDIGEFRSNASSIQQIQHILEIFDITKSKTNSME